MLLRHTYKRVPTNQKKIKMNRIILILFVTFNWSCFSQTQHEMHKQASEEHQKADTELNNVYKKILTEYKADTSFIDRFIKAQSTWITHRDAELEMRFPAENKQLEYGSVYPMCVAVFLKELTEERTEKLKIWLTGIEEGTICSGSIKVN